MLSFVVFIGKQSILMLLDKWWDNGFYIYVLLI